MTLYANFLKKKFRKLINWEEKSNIKTPTLTPFIVYEHFHTACKLL